MGFKATHLRWVHSSKIVNTAEMYDVMRAVEEMMKKNLGIVAKIEPISGL